MKRFFHELRRRKVTRVAAIYALVAWAVIEASSVIFPALQLPDWTVTFVVAVALIGFPVALIFSWVFDWTHEGIVKTPGRESLPEAERDAHRRGRAVDFIIIAVLVAVIGWLGWERIFDREQSPEAGILDSIAVLPFVNMSGDPENEYFGDGLAEELLNALVRVDGLRVAARTSSFEYKGRNQDVRLIGEALNVATILEGSVRKAGSRIRVTAQLVRVDDGFHLWSETYDRNLVDIFAVQDEISLAIVDALRVTLGTQDRDRVTTRHTRDVDAFEAYLRGRYEMNRRTAASLQRALGHFEQAIEFDPEYAAAYSGLSDTWILRASYGSVANETAVEQAEPMARRALALDPELAEAHASLGLVLRNKEDNEGAIGPLLRAIELNPSYSPAYHWLGNTYQALSRFEESLEVLGKSIEIDPHYITGKRAYMTALRLAGREDEAREFGYRLVRDHPDDPLVHYQLATFEQVRGLRSEAFRHIARAITISPNDPLFRMQAAYLLLGAEDIDRAEAQVAVIRRLVPAFPALETWERDVAMMTLDPALLELQVDRILAMPDGEKRDEEVCTSFLLVDRLEEGAQACRRTLERLGWSPGQPLVQQHTNAAGNLLVYAIAMGHEAEKSALLDEFSGFIDRMEAGGMNELEIEWNRALIRAHRDGDTTPLMAMLPTYVVERNWNWRNMRLNPLFLPVRQDPRFIETVERLRENLARDRETMRGITLPD